MSTLYMPVENITEGHEQEGETRTYSIIDNMTCYRVKVVDGCEYEAYTQEGELVDDENLAGTLIDQVIEYQKGE